MEATSQDGDKSRFEVEGPFPRSGLETKKNFNFPIILWCYFLFRVLVLEEDDGKLKVKIGPSLRRQGRDQQKGQQDVIHWLKSKL